MSISSPPPFARFAFALIGAAALAALGCGGTCSKDSDCGAGLSCASGNCQVHTPSCDPACTAETPICDLATLACRVCTDSRGCAPGLLCDSSQGAGACVACRTDANCPISKPVCDRATHICVACTSAGGCLPSEICDTRIPTCVTTGCSLDVDCVSTPSTPVCDTSANQCAHCTETAGCTGNTTCDTAVPGGQCVGCLSNSHCSPQAPVCDVASHECIVCTAEQGCSAGQWCDTATALGRCRAGCAADSDCASTPKTPVCDKAAHQCAASADHGCAVDADCQNTPSTPICDVGSSKCVACTAARGCSGGVCDTSVAGGKCVDCLSSGDCKAPGPFVCDAAAKKCVVCTATEGCPKGQTCDTSKSLGACVGCGDSTQCSASTPVCDVSRSTCVICTASEGCSSGVCDTSIAGGVCVGCLSNADCKAPGPTLCSGAKCVVCTAPAVGCAQGQTCDLTNPLGACVGCGEDAQCSGSTPVCDVPNHTCVLCTATKGCSGSTAVCSVGPPAACVQCLSNADCAGTPATPICSPSKICVAADTSGEIAAARAAANGTGLSLPIHGAVVTTVKPALTGEAGGFFIQAAKTGPALFVSVPKSTAAPIRGDRVNFTITAMTTLSGLRAASAITGFQSLKQGEDVQGLLQDLSSATDVVSGLDGYESEAIALTGTLRAFAVDGSYQKAPLTSVSSTSPTSSLGELRIPETVRASLDLTQGCSVSLKQGVMWRSTTEPQPSAFEANDLAVLSCPAPGVARAVATSATTVAVTFDRAIGTSSLKADGSQFTFSDVLKASAASVSGTSVTVTTSSGQIAGQAYTVTVASSLTDTRGTGVDSTRSTATFSGFDPCAPHVVISQIYGGGGSSSSAAFKNDFVELFNRAAVDADITGWSIQYAAPSSATWTVAALNSALASQVVIPAGGYFLVQLAAGDSGQALPKFDASSALINLGIASGKVALVENMTPLSGICPASGFADLVAYGNNTGCTTHASAPSTPATTSIIRALNGCKYTASNSSDFATSSTTIVPRNSASAIVICSCQL